jgi:hypothetical protein
MTYINEDLENLFGNPENHVLNHSHKTQVKKPKKKKRKIKLVVIALVLIFIVFPAISSAFGDQFTTAFYSGPDQVKQLAEQGGMNTHGKALFYSANPEIVDYQTLQTQCPNESEESIEFGCYIPARNKIYILKITDPRISELMVITASHEMLHKAFSEMAYSEKSNVAEQLNKLKDANVSDANYNEIIKPYTDTNVSGDDLDDELHSLIGTEISVTNDQLENHYLNYFVDRQANIVKELTVKNALDDISSGLETERTNLSNQEAQLNHTYEVTLSVKQALDRAEYRGDIYNYNANVPIFNKDLGIYKDQLTNYNSAVDAYNAKLNDYQAIFTNLKSAPRSSNTIP